MIRMRAADDSAHVSRNLPEALPREPPIKATVTSASFHQ
jgi:hypothetical protein